MQSGQQIGWPKTQTHTITRAWHKKLTLFALPCLRASLYYYISHIQTHTLSIKKPKQAHIHTKTLHNLKNSSLFLFNTIWCFMRYIIFNVVVVCIMLIGCLGL